MMNSALISIVRKEVAVYLGSAMGYLFLGVFLTVSLFTFFWVEGFFARNIADVRPLFAWMPILLIFLCAALTMRAWSEERRQGTFDYLLTQPIGLWPFVWGKFLSCLVLLAIALLFTLPLPITVAFLGDLDTGPVVGGYIASLLLGAAYIALGLFVSAGSQNQIVSLMVSVAIGALLWLAGETLIVQWLPGVAGDMLAFIGTGARFDAITRGVLDVRDLYYYVSLIVAFLLLNVWRLERVRWSAHRAAKTGQRAHHRGYNLAVFLVIANVLIANVWLQAMTSLRVDTTEGRMYSLSPVTKDILANADDIITIRGYFSNQTHPLLAPLVPQAKDLLAEYDEIGGATIALELIDPKENPELEEEANQRFNIQPTPFQIADRYQAAMVNAYFDIAIEYGDQSEVLSFRDLIEVKSTGDAQGLDVRLRNLEYDVTKTIRKVIQNYQEGGDLLAAIQTPLTLTHYVSAREALPESLQAYDDAIATVVAELQTGTNGGVLTYERRDPITENLTEAIREAYGFSAMRSNIFDETAFYFYLVLTDGVTAIPLPLGDLNEANFRRTLEAVIKRFSQGFTKTVAMPTFTDGGGQLGQPGQSIPRQFEQIQGALSELNINTDSIEDGVIDGQSDALVLLAPESITEAGLFAVDQYLMRGGTVIAAYAPLRINLSNENITASDSAPLFGEWLAHHGFTMEDALVMDTNSAPFPVPVERVVGTFRFREYQMLQYPYFVDVREAGYNQDYPIATGIPSVIMAWSAPLTIAPSTARESAGLLYSSENAWLSRNPNVVPVLDANGQAIFDMGDDFSRRMLAGVQQGVFTSYFAGRENPLLESATTNTEVITSVIEASPSAARLMVFASNEAFRDTVASVIGSANRQPYEGSAQLLANTLDWVLDDGNLQSIRATSHFNRTLRPIGNDARALWEYGNYAVVVLLILALFFYHRITTARARAYVRTRILSA